MRPLEILILAANLIALYWLARPGPHHTSRLRFLPGITLLIIMIHLALEHYRWQMVPAYALTAIFLLLSLLKRPAPAATARWVLTGVGALAWLVSAALPVILPVPLLPDPPGPYHIGTTVFDWTDPTRPEVYTRDPADPRRILVQIWYPAVPVGSARPAPLIDHWDIAGPAIAGYLGLPSFAVDQFALVRTHTLQDAPVLSSGGPFPVVVFSHGYSGYRTAGFSQAEALASSGFVVVAIDHPHSAMFTVFPDGQAVLNTPDVLPDGDAEARTILESVHAADLRFVLDQLERLNDGEFDQQFRFRLDLQKVGLAGVSTGGGAVVWACHQDPRCKAALVMDGWFEPLPAEVMEDPITQPVLFMQSATRLWKRDNQPRLNQLYNNAAGDAYHLVLPGLMHHDFGDYPLATPLTGVLPERGDLAGDRAVEVVNTYLLAFFNQYIGPGGDGFLLGPSAAYPEVQFSFRIP